LPSKKLKREIKRWNQKNEKQKSREKKVKLKREEEYKQIRKKKTTTILTLLNPKNLQKEVHIYGYHFSEFTHALTIVLVLLACAGVGILFELHVYCIVFITVVAMCILPLFILDMFHRMYEQKRFAQAGQYVEQILYSFKHKQKIYAALYDCLLVFEDGLMKDKMKEAILYIDTGKTVTDRGILREALDIIEEAFPNDKIRNANQLLVSVEERGGEYEESAKLLLEDNNQWIRRGYGLQADKKQRHLEVTFSIITSIILCAAVLYSLNWMGNIADMQKHFNIFQYSIIQTTSCIFIIFLLFVYYKSSKTLTNDWLASHVLEKEKLLLSSYEYVIRYKESKAQKKSILYAAPIIPCIIPVYLFSYKWICIPLFILSCIFLFQHKIGYFIAKQSVVRQLYLSFPQWLMDLALLLQNNNVFVSITKSQKQTNIILQKELEKLLIRMQENPNRINAYTEFCKEFDIPEIYSCMKMLYSIAESGTGNVNQQIQELLMQMNEMEAKAEEIENEHIKFKMEKIFFYPIAAVCLKMSFDMSFGMILMISSFQSVFIGG